MKNQELLLVLAGPSFSDLVEIRFSHPLAGERIVATRGKTSGAYLGYGTFQCTKAVLALCCAVAHAVLKGRCHDRGPSPDIYGPKGSLASSLDYALAKLPLWLVDTFGTDSRGFPNCRRLFLISNPGQKRPGNVAIRLNEAFLPLDCIKFIYPNGKDLADTVLINALRENSSTDLSLFVGQQACSDSISQQQALAP